MNRFIYLVQVVLIVNCNSQSNNSEYFELVTVEQDSNDYDNDIEVNNISILQENEPSGEHAENLQREVNNISNSIHLEDKLSLQHAEKLQRVNDLNQTWQNLREFFARGKGELTTKTVPHADEEQFQRSTEVEEDDEENKRTLIDYPFSVSIQKKGAHYVSGALIDERWILSVAGEFYNVRESLKLFRARLGSVDCKRGGSLVPIKRIDIHPYYVYGKPNFDVALLRIALPVAYSTVLRPIKMSNIKEKVLSAKFMTTYWPRIVLNGHTLPETATERIKYNSMRVSTQRLIPTDLCKTIMKALKEVLNDSSLCLNPVVTHHSICVPDAGAPVVAEDGLWGITSGWIASTCPNFAAPTIFTRLSSGPVRSWLDTQLLLDL